MDPDSSHFLLLDRYRYHLWEARANALSRIYWINVGLFRTSFGSMAEVTTNGDGAGDVLDCIGCWCRRV